MIKTLKKIANEFKRYNDIKEKELDLKILDRFDFKKKWGVSPTYPTTTPHQVILYSADNKEHTTNITRMSSINVDPYK